ncbi:MAG TPA: amino acid deaminase/aldolase [Roseiflexaceae bacterium]|nr:amino acid deaminase/aldolase [Roseiflexaceae bacterium]
MPDYQYYKNTFRGQLMPFAFVDLDLLKSNIRQTVMRAGGKRIRIASKSIRCLALIELILASDPAFRGVMCFTAPEAVWLSQRGLDDLLIGYPCWHADQVRALCDELRQGKTIVAMVDSIAHVEHLEACAAASGVILPVCLDLDMALDLPSQHVGVWRSSVRSVADALRVYAAIERSRHLRLDGVMGYEAQVAGLGDDVPGQPARGAAIRLLKRLSVTVVARRRAAAVLALARHGAHLRFVNGGGTGSLETTAREAVVTELAAGSSFFAPGLFDHYRAFRHMPAAGFAIEIVRRPQPGIYTCLGGGYVSSGGAGPALLPRPYLPSGVRLSPNEGAGEVQTPIHYQGGEQLCLGDPIFLRHSKAGELCERFNSLLLASDGAVVGQAPTYRGEGQAFL